ncbi:MAG TPA: branched-chain amino acid aminotransferase [Flavipsychrobacter sp.]
MDVFTLDIRTQKTDKSRLHELDKNNIEFGKVYSDHMLVADYVDGAWNQAEIIPYGEMSMSPATSFFHYGQAIFEGVKAYKDPEGNPVIFRPQDNWKRMNRSAIRMGMPGIPEELFMEGMRQLIDLDKEWIPEADRTSLYIRPFMMAIDEFIGIKPTTKFRFMIITSPAGPYYAEPVSIYVDENYVRAFPGGVGYTKAAGNYGGSMYPMTEVRKKGYHQILWMDGIEHKYVQEIGTMNVFFVLGDTIVTPELSDTILEGITRDSVITILKEHGYNVEERPLHIDEIVEAYNAGQLKEAFGTGTAASIAPIADLTYREQKMSLPPQEDWKLAPWLREELNAIRYGRKPDTRGWVYRF